MARRRMIEVSIAHDKAFNRLSDFSQLLFLKVLPHTDDYGRFEGDPEIVKARVDPLSSKKISVYRDSMDEIAKSGLWIWYETEDGKQVVQMNVKAFERINAFLIKKRGNEEYPAYIDSYKSISNDIQGISHSKYKAESNKQEVESKKQKEAFGEFRNVFLTDLEYGKLMERLDNSERVKNCIEILSAYKESKGKTYKSDYAAMGTWVIGELEKRENGNGTHQSSVGRNNQTRPSPTVESAQRTLEKTERRIAARDNSNHS